MVEVKDKVIFMSSQGDFLPGRHRITKLVVCCETTDHVIKVADGEGFVHMEMHGREDETQQMDFNPPVKLVGIKLKELRPVCAEVYLYEK